MSNIVDILRILSRANIRGVTDATGGTDGGDIFTGNIVGSQVNGTWTNPSNNWRGSFTGSKQ